MYIFSFLCYSHIIPLFYKDQKLFINDTLDYA